MENPISFYFQTPYEDIVTLWSTEYPMLNGLPEYWAPIDIWWPYPYDIDKNAYYISTYGRLYSKYVNRLIPGIYSNGYKFADICIRNNYKKYIRIGIHRLVGIAFKPVNGMELLYINHLDEIKDHNWIWNLEWTTPKGNTRYSMNTGTIKCAGQYNNSATITDAEAETIAKLLSTTTMTYTEIANAIGPHCSNIVVGKIARGERRTELFNKYNLEGTQARKPIQRINIPNYIIDEICYFMESYFSIASKDRIRGSLERLFNLIIYIFDLPNTASTMYFLKALYYRKRYIDISKRYVW